MQKPQYLPDAKKVQTGSASFPPPAVYPISAVKIVLDLADCVLAVTGVSQPARCGLVMTESA